DKDHLKLLSTLARALVKKSFTTALREAREPGQVVELIDGVLSGTPAPAAPAAPAPQTPSTAPEAAGAQQESGARIIAVTACPTGIAHTY
ncbi:hypothetical protein KZ294_26325, partial [Escherichia coli]|nr:hypothetical protein [Escherichia coli]